jgi:syntaxin 5
MGVTDRTDEFRQLIGAVKEAKPCSECQTAQQGAHHSTLNMVSADIGSMIHQTSLNVQELRKIAKQNGNFKDTTSTIHRMTTSIKRDINEASQKIHALEQKNCEAFGRSNRTLHVHSANIIKTLNARLCDVTKEFQSALEDGAKSLENKYKRQEQLGYVPLKPQPVSGLDYDFDHRTSQQVLAQDPHLSRQDAIKNIHATIGDVATMFQRMIVLVRTQDDMIQGIQDDIEDTSRNVEQGQNALLAHWKSMSSNRSIILKVFLILIFFVVFFICFLA